MFFSKMGTVWHQLPDKSQIIINDITTFVNFSDLWKKDVRTQLKYRIQDGDLPHTISNKLYGNVDYWWSVLLFNTIWDYDEQWPRTDRQMAAYIESKYPGQSINNVHHYITTDGLIADLLSLRIKYNTLDNNVVISKAGLEAISIIDHEDAINDLKRNIVLVDPDYIAAVDAEFERLMQPLEG